MAEIKHLKCPACSASLDVASDTTRGVYAYCGNSFVLEIDEGEAVLRSTQEITGAIEAGTEQTLTELQRMQLVQQHGDLSQQYTALSIHLDALESELRELQRSKQTNIVRAYVQELEVRRREIRLQVRELQSDMKRINAILNPHEVEEVELPAPPQRPRRTLRRGCLWIFGIAIVLAFIGAQINSASSDEPLAVDSGSVEPASQPSVGPQDVSANIPVDVVATPIPTPEIAPVDDAEPEPSPTLVSIATVTTEANVRNLPTTIGSEILGQVRTGEVLTLRMRNVESTWLGIMSPAGLRGWVSASLLSFDQSAVSSLPIGSGTDAVGQ